MLANEFHNLDLVCSPSDVIPRGPSYTTPEFQTCLLQGSTPGSLIVSGDAYLSTSFSFHYSRIWFNLGIMAVQAVAFLIIGVVATEFLHFAPGGTRRIWARTKRVKRRLARQWYKDDGEESMGPAFSLAPMFEDDESGWGGQEEDEGEQGAGGVEEVKGSNLVVSSRVLVHDLTPTVLTSVLLFAVAQRLSMG